MQQGEARIAVIKSGKVHVASAVKVSCDQRYVTVSHAVGRRSLEGPVPISEVDIDERGRVRARNSKVHDAVFVEVRSHQQKATWVADAFAGGEMAGRAAQKDAYSSFRNEYDITEAVSIHVLDFSRKTGSHRVCRAFRQRAAVRGDVGSDRSRGQYG